MAKYYTDFRDEWIGNGPPTDWMVRINANGGTFSKIRSTTTPGGKVFRIVSSGNGSTVTSFNPANDATDVETLVKFRVNGSASGRQGIALHRYSGTSEATTSGYALQFLPASNVRSLLISNDQTGATITFTNYAWTNNTIYWARFRTVGNAIQAKIWAEGEEEPASWMLNTTDNSFTGGSGTYNGVGTFTANPDGVDFMEYAVATEGETATRELPQPATFPNGYLYRKKVTAKASYLSTNAYSGVMVVQGTFPELKAVPLGGRIYHAQDYHDITFTDMSGNQLDWGMEVYNNGTGALTAWVKAPGGANFRSTDTDDNRSIYMYYGKPLMENRTTNMNAVWSGYDFALLMNGGQGGGNETTYPQGEWFAPENANWETVSGAHGLARKFNAGGIYKNYEARYDLHRGLTLSMQVRFNTLPASGQNIPLYQIVGMGAFRYDNVSGTRRLNMVKYGVVDQYVTANLNAGQWYHLTCVVDTSETRYYVNGALIGSYANSSNFNARTAGKQPSIMWPDGGGQVRLNVDIDTMNMVSNARPAWAITVEYNNQSKSDFWDIGSEEIAAIVLESATHSLDSEGVELVEHKTLILDNSFSGHAAEVISLVYHDVLSAPNGSSHTTKSDVLELIKNVSLIMSDTLHSFTSSNITVNFGSLLQMNNALHSLVTENVSLSQAQLIAIQDTLHTLASSLSSVTENKTLSIGSAVHATKSDVIKLLENYILAVSNLIHGHEAGSVVLLQSNLLSVNSTLHELKSNIVDILEYTLLGKPHDAKHTVVSVDVNLVQEHILAVENVLNILKSDESRVINWDQLSVGFGNYRPTIKKDGELVSVELDSVGIYLGNLAKSGELKKVEIDQDGSFKPVRPEKGKY